MEVTLDSLYQNLAGITKAQSMLWLLFLDNALVFGVYLVLVVMGKMKEKVNYTVLTFLTLTVLAIVTFYKDLEVIIVYVVACLFTTAMFITFRKNMLLSLIFVVLVTCEFIAMKLWLKPYDLLISMYLLVFGLILTGMVIRAVYQREH